MTDATAPVAVTTLGSVDLAKTVSQNPPLGLNIVGKVETENIGIEKIIKNVISNPAIRYLICAGNEPPKHLTGATLFALFQNGMDEGNKITGAPGMRPVLPNTSTEEVMAFREQVELIDMIGCTDITTIHERVVELAQSDTLRSMNKSKSSSNLISQAEAEHVVAIGTEPQKIKLDKAGYFVINVEDKTLLVEHYSYKNELIRVIEGGDARSIYLTLVRNGWVSELDHAAYLGKELARAQWSLEHNVDYVQDGA